MKSLKNALLSTAVLVTGLAAAFMATDMVAAETVRKGPMVAVRCVDKPAASSTCPTTACVARQPVLRCCIKWQCSPPHHW
jgi:hypothetical protein